MGRRGLTHVEMILSFTIFVTAVGFALYFFSPTNTSRLVESSFDYIQREVKQNVSVGLDTYSIKVNGVVEAESLSNPPYSNTLPINISGVCEIPNSVWAMDISGDEIPSKIGSGGGKCNTGNANSLIYVKKDSWDERDFVVLRISEDIEPYEDVQKIGNPPLKKEFYEISTFDTKTLFSERRILALNKSYHEDYLELKENFNIPGRVNFEFSFIFSDFEVRADRFVPSGLDVYSKSERVEVLREDGNVEYVDFVIRVW